MKDIDRIADYHLMTVGPQSAEKITDKILDTIALLEDYLYSGSEISDPALQRQGYRKLICGDYVCIYRVIEETAYIYHVVHSATNYPRLLR
jgi:toxin ParE1/3/4